MEPLGRDLARFLQLLQSFQCQKVPCDLLIRACESRPAWSSTGEITDRLPLEAGVSEWLVDFYNVNKRFLHGTALESYKRYIKYNTGIDGVAYLEVTSEGQPDLEVIDERILAHERIATILQAFPSNNAEIIGDEIIDRLMDVVKTSIIPLLSSLTEADIEYWLLPKTHKDREAFLISMVEFLYQVIDRLGIENPHIPLPLLKQLSNVIANQTVTNISIGLRKISQVLDAYNGNNALQSIFWSSGARTDQRSNALIGHILSMLLSKEASMGEPTESLARALSGWRPLSWSKPSTMEYLAATSFCMDSVALQGLLLSRRKQHKDAAEFLSSTMGAITSQHGSCSMQLGLVTAELANCYNILRQEDKAEICVRTTLQAREGRSLSTRRDEIYLQLALSDSLIGRARYSEAVPVLESIIGSSDISATLRMMSALRLAKSRRRMHEDSQRAFEVNSPLWTGLTLLHDVPGDLSIEYVEELACSISELPKKQLGDSNGTQEVIEAVDSILGGSSYLIDYPCWEWYSEVKQKYLGEVTKASRVDKGKELDDGSRKEAENGMGKSASPPPRAGYDMFDETGPWSKKLVLTFDRNGVAHAISSLLILKRIMHEIRQLEIYHEDGPAYFSSSFSWTSYESGQPAILKVSDRIDEFLPCHYFDYMFGSSTGGINSIMLGRLRMSVDQAIDNFIDYANAVFSHPRFFYGIAPGPKYSVDRAREAFIKIVDNSESPQDRLFIPLGENGCRTRTSTQRNRLATIWEVACATSAARTYFNPIKIEGKKFYAFEDYIQIWSTVDFLRSFDSQGMIHGVVYVNLGAVKFTPSSYGSAWETISFALGAGKRLYDMPYDDWRPATTGNETLHEITDITYKYLDRDDVKGIISRIAQVAVRVRRARARTEQWKDFV
ncbi:hypothetical protein ACKAV7_009760 [Fusarium commune]